MPHTNQLPSTAEIIDLKEWTNTRVLALTNGYYAPGVIRKTDENNSVLVEFDSPDNCTEMYSDVFTSRIFHVILDASPSAAQVVYRMKPKWMLDFNTLICSFFINIDRPRNESLRTNSN